MKKIALLSILMLAPLPALAQSADPLFTSGADIPAVIAKAKAAQTSPNVNSTQPVATFGPYRVQLEYRTGLTPPTVHHGEAELVQVVKGNATFASGGKLVGGAPVRPGSTTDAGTGIEGASTRKLASGDIFLVPPDTAHQFQDVKGEFVIISVHMFMPQAK